MKSIKPAASPKARSGDDKSVFIAVLLGLTGIFIFGTTLPATKLAMTSFSPWFITFARASIAGALAICFLTLTRRSFLHKSNLQIFIAGTMIVYGFPGFMAVALQTVESFHAGVVLGFLPLSTALFATIFAGEKQSVRFWILALSGALITAIFAYQSSGNVNQSAGFAIGDFWLLLAGLCASLGYVISGKLSRSMPGWEVVSRALILNLPIVLVGTWWLYEPRFAQATPAALAGLLYVSIFSMFLGFFAWNTALAKGGIGKIGQLQLLQTFVTLTASAVLLGEHISWIALLTALIISVIIYLAKRA